jgi:hypothetical protein
MLITAMTVLVMLALISWSLSQKDLGMPLRIKSMEREWAQAISVYDVPESAIEQAKRLPFLGSYHAKIVIPDDEIIEVAQTGKNPHHFSIYAPAWKVMDMVEGNTIPVEKRRGNG